MKSNKEPSKATYGRILNVKELGGVIRTFRKSRQLTLEKVSGITNISMKFLSELERGKETAEIGKTLATINQLGLELIIQPRGANKPLFTITKQDKKGKSHERK
jgi:HTH-type transcriptional regulator / antitoxin HipB